MIANFFIIVFVLYLLMGCVGFVASLMEDYHNNGEVVIRDIPVAIIMFVLGPACVIMLLHHLNNQAWWGRLLSTPLIRRK